jgi:hypothetical protein
MYIASKGLKKTFDLKKSKNKYIPLPYENSRDRNDDFATNNQLKRA